MGRFLLVLLSVLSLGTTAWAANPAGDLRIEVISAYNFIVDSNIESPSGYSPRSAYVGATFYNDGANDMTNFVAYIGNYIDGTNDTPGTYPMRAHLSLVGPLVSNQFALTHEGGTSGTGDAIRYMGRLPAGEGITVYWLISYPLTDVNGDAVHGPSVKPDDDLWLEYDIWGKVEDAGVTVIAEETRRVTMRNEISAMANKIVPNTANKVPQVYLDLLQQYAPTWTNASTDGTVGTEISSTGYWYDLGVIGQGFDNNGDLVPDMNAWMQPVGDPSLFDSSAFRLVRTRTMVVVKLKTGGEQVYLTEDQLYFENMPENNGAIGLVIYDFCPMKVSAAVGLSPYQEVASGYDNEKFNGDYGLLIGNGLLSSSSHVTLDKTADRQTVALGNNIAYTMNFANTSSVSFGNADQGVPLVIQDSIPTGTLYVAGSATASNVLPAGINHYTVLFSTNNGAAWTGTEPAAGRVTDIQWWLSDPLAGGASGTVRFIVTLTNNYSGRPLILNTAGASLGNNDPFDEDDADTLVLGTNRVGDTVFVDNGVGGGYFGNGVQDGTEGGLSNITVRLYYDANSNGVVDTLDFIISTTNSATNGAYLFNGLPDGAYVAVVDSEDGDIPFGYTITTSTYFSASLDLPRTNNASVSFLSADWGFAPALVLDKSGTNIVREGGTITYTIVLTNRLAGDGGISDYEVWAGVYDTTNSGTGNREWLNYSNAFYPTNGPDGLYATAPMANVDEKIATKALFLGAQFGNITNVEITFAVTTNGIFNGADGITFNLLEGGVAVFTTNPPLSSITNGTLRYNVTSLKNWSWTNFAGTNAFSLQAVANGGGGGPSYDGVINIDHMGFRILSDQSPPATNNPHLTIDPLPLTDTYDADQLEFVSASVTPDSVSTSGVAPNKVATNYWSNLGPLYPGGFRTITVTYNVLEPLNNTSTTVTNVAFTLGATYANGRPANAATDTVTSAMLPAGSIGDYVWRDRDGDGVQDGGEETGIFGVDVVLTPPPGVDVGRGAGLPVTNRTDTNGYYLFTGLPADGSYTVTVSTATLPGGSGTNTFDRDGTNNSRTIVAIDYDSTTGGDTVTNADFGYQISSVIRGTVWHDMDHGGETSPESGEDLLTNVTVYLFLGATGGSPATAIATNRTGTNGTYQFVGNYTGIYSVLVWTNSGQMSNTGPWTTSYDTDGLSTSNLVSFGIVGGGSAQADFSYYRTGDFIIGDTLFYDWDGDRVQDTNEEGVVNITVRLYEDRNTNGVVDIGQDAFIAMTNTSGTGGYYFVSLPASNYLIIVDHTDTNFPDLFSVTADPQGVNDGRAVLSLTSNRLDQDFGYQPYGIAAIGDTVWFDFDGNGVQSGARETGLVSITVALWVDMDNDGIYHILSTTQTGTNGYYLFDNLPNGNYQVRVDTNDASLPVDGYGALYYPTTPATRSITIANQTDNLTADFGFTALGAIGDTIFWDANQNGTQDWNENGVDGVAVSLYIDVNTNDVYDVGDTFYALDATDTNGNYLFPGLTSGYYVVVVSEVGALLGKDCSADPDADGVPYGPGTDGEYALHIDVGSTYLGADFGYVPDGALGDTVWMDINTNGVKDSTEVGIPYITVQLWSNGVLMASNVTDADGFYLFSDIPDRNYRVVVLTNDSDFPSGLTNVYDVDGVRDHMASNIIVATGRVVSIAGVPCASNCDMTIDFGYRYSGTNILSGTVGLDATPYDGILGTGPNGVSTDEAAFGNVTLYLYLWDDINGDTNVNSGETRLIVSTTTSTNGDYSFSNLPTGATSNRYIVSLAAPDVYLRMTTTNGSTPAYRVQETVNLSTNTISAYQIVTIQPVNTNIDFAFRSTVPYDFGDLPQSYLTRFEGVPTGPRHQLRATPNLYLGTNVDAEVNGTPSVLADGDGGDENGVVPLSVWRAGTNGGQLSVTVGSGSGWLLGYVDFETNGTFYQFGDMILNEVAATNGVYTNVFAIPLTNAISQTTTTIFYARFRIMPSEPMIPELSFFGYSANGEVEDYRWLFGVIGDFVWKDTDADAVYDSFENPIAGVRVYVDLSGDGLYQTNEPSTTTATNGYYSIGGFAPGTHSIRVDTNTLPAYVVPTYDQDGTGTAHYVSAVITNGEVRLDVDFGYAGLALGGQIWNDTNTNGLQDEVGLTGVSNVIVRLYDASTNWVSTVQSDTNGIYIFDIAAPGDFFLEFFPINYNISPRDQGTNDTYDSDVTTNAPYRTIYTTISAGEREDYWDLGLYRPAQSNTVGDRVWLDADQDGQLDTNEIGIANVAVTLYDSSTNIVRTTITDVDGFYYFSGLPSNTYFVGFSPPLNYTLTLRDTGSDVTDSDPDITNGFTASFLVTNGFATTNLDAGLLGRLDLGVTKVIDNNDPDPSNTVRFTILVTNNGPLAASDVRYTDVWPSSTVTYVSSASSRGSYNPTNGIWSIGTLSNGYTATLTLTGTVNAGTAGLYISNVVSLTYLNQSDTNSTNNTAIVVAPIRSLDLAVVKTVNTNDTYEGSNVIYTIVITNSGAKNATGVVVTEPLPSGLTHVTNSVSQGSFSGTSLVWSVGSLASNTSASMTLTALVGTSTGGRSLTNTVTIIAVDQTDTISTNNSSTQVIQVRGADVGVLKSADVTIASLGDTVVFTVLVTNLGPNAVTNVQVRDNIPLGVTHVTNTLSQGAYSPTSGLWSVGSLGLSNGASMSLTVTVETNGLYRAITNIANVATSSLPDPNSLNNSATSRVAISYLKIFKGASPVGPIDLGSNITYTITVTNSGLAFQTNVCVSDPMPNGTLYVGGSSALQAPTSSISTYRDEFNAVAFSNQNGTANWANNWQELGEVDGAAGGDVVVTPDSGRTNVVAVENNANGLWRMVNVISNKRVTLSFDFRRSGLDAESDFVGVYASSNGGSSWAEIGRMAGASNETAYVSTSIVVSSYITTNMAIRFLSSGMANGDIVYLDNIQLYAERRYMQSLTGTSPPALLTGQLLEDGEYAIMTLEAQVQTPPPTDVITNIASVTSVLETTPLTAFTNTPVSISDLGVTKDASTNLFSSNSLVVYSITVTNNGDRRAREVIMNDYWPTNINFLSAQVSQGTYSTDNATNHVWSIGTLDYLAGASLVISGQVSSTIGTNVLVITNTAIVSSVKSYDRNSSNDRDGIALATLVVLTRMEGFIENGISALEWETASEVDTIGFWISRVDASGVAERLHEGILPCVFGAAQGAIYRLAMPDLAPGQVHRILLEEVELDGDVNRYGPFDITPAEEGGILQLGGLSYTNQMRHSDEPIPDAAVSLVELVKNAKRKSLMGGSGGAMDEAPVPLTLQVATSGIYYADAATLAYVMNSAESAVSGLISSGMVSLTTMGQDVAIRFAGDRFYFFGEATNSPYTRRGIYKLAWTQGLAMSNAAGGSPQPDPLGQSFSDSAWFENETASATAVANSPADDYWFWDFFVAGNPSLGTRSLALMLPDVVPGSGDAIIRVGLQGASSAASTNDHHIDVFVGGTNLGSVVWKGVTPTNVTVACPPDLLLSSTNTLVLNAVLDSGVPYSIVYLDQVDVSYERYSTTLSGQLIVHDEGTPVITVGGLSSTNILVLAIDSGNTPYILENVTIDQTGAVYRVSVTQQFESGRYAIADTAMARLPESITIDNVSDLRASTNAADYIVLTDASLLSSAGTLANYRQSTGLDVKVVRIDDVYDEFAYGVPDPNAIRDFLSYARTNWTVAPRYVLFAGEGTYDYRNRLSYGDNLIPVLMIMTPSGLFASDGAYADFDGDMKPEIALGRLPARTTTELDRMITRIQSYEAVLDDSWQEQVLFAADNPDTGGDFHASSERVSEYVPITFLRDEALMASGGLTATRQHVIDGLNDGRLMFNYFGHGGVDRLASEGILTSTDVASLSNSNRLTIATSMSCAMGQFPIPGFDCLGETLMLASNGGAIAIWAPTGLSYNRHAETLCALVYQSIFEEGHVILGDAIAAAIIDYQNVALSGYGYMSQIYNLMGDPALRVAGLKANGLTPARTITEWSRNAFTTSERQDPAISGADADADADGKSNLMEYLFGLDPRVTQSAFFMIPLGNATDLGMPAYDATYEFTRRKNVADYQFALAASTNLLSGWGLSTNGILESTVTDTGDGVTETVRIHMRHPEDGGYLFLKLDIIGP